MYLPWLVLKIGQYLRLMVIWTITTAFSGVYQSLVWLENSSGSETEHILVKALLMLSIGGMVGNVSTSYLSASVQAPPRYYGLCATIRSLIGVPCLE